MTATLTQLSNLIVSSISTLEKVLQESNSTFPSLDDAFNPASEAFRANAAAAEAANIIAAAAHQLVALTLPPPSALYSVVSGQFKSAALRVCLEANVTEILREGGPQGVHVKDIGEKANISSDKIARLLRYLATHHVYREISPDVFTNTRISSMLDTGKSVKELFANPEDKHDGTHGLTALVGHHLDECYKASAYLWENMSDPLSSGSTEPNKSPLSRVYNIDGTFWTLLEQADQVHRRRRFNIAMKGVAALEPADAILSAFDWKSLPKESIVVDVGGGVGASSMRIAKENPNIKIVVQDQPNVVEEGKVFWQDGFPEAISSGRVTLQAHDFFQPQPVKNASVFLLKQIMHDWSDPYAIKILTQLRNAAQPNTKLILIDSLIPFACHDSSADETQGVPGSVPKEAPAPLLANYGIANEMGYHADLVMLLLFNCQERTVKHLSEMLLNTGWRLTKVVRDSSSNFLQPVEAVPIF